MKQPVDRSILVRFIGITLVNALLFFSSQFFGTTLPIYLHDLSGSNSIVGICTAIGTIAALIIRPIAGVAVDRIGRAPILLAGSLLMVLTFASFSVFHTVAAAIVIRFLYGFAWGTASTASNTIAADLIPQGRFGEWMGYFTLSQSFAMAIAPSIALSIMGAYGFPALMLVAAVLGGIVFVIGLIIRQKATRQAKKTSFAPYEKSAMRPALLMLISGISLGAMFSFSVLFGKSMGFANVGLYFTFFAGTLFIGRPLVGRLIDRTGFQSALLFGFLGYTVSLLMLWRAQTDWMYLSSAALSGVTYGAIQNSLQTMSVISAPPERRGAANATYFSGFDAGLGFGSLIAGFLANALGYSSMFAILSIPTLLAAAIYWVGERKNKQREKDAVSSATVVIEPETEQNGERKYA